MTFRILEPPSALPQFPFLPAPVFQALLRHPQPEGCRDWGDAPPSPGGLEHPSYSASSQQLPKAKHQQPTGCLGQGCAVFQRGKDLENQQEGKHQLLGASFSEGSSPPYPVHAHGEAKSRSWHHTGAAQRGGNAPTPLLESSPTLPRPNIPLPPSFPRPQLPWLPLLSREGEAVQLAHGGSGQAV